MRKYKPIEERFWDNVSKSDGCWDWTACLSTSGYGMIFSNGKSRIASRLSYQLAYGDFDQKLCVLHKCDNRKCVRPDHLFLGTVADNSSDMMAKGRGRPGGLRRWKLSIDDVKTIRHLYWAERRRQREIAAFFGICYAHVSNIVNDVPVK